MELVPKLFVGGALRDVAMEATRRYRLTYAILVVDVECCLVSSCSRFSIMIIASLFFATTESKYVSKYLPFSPEMSLML